MGRVFRMGLAGALGLLLFVIANVLGCLWLSATEFASDSFYDGCAAILTLALPGFLGGLVIGGIARERALPVTLVSFLLLALASFVHPLWRVPLVSPHSVHSGGMHYFLRNPIVALTFAAVGAWLMSQFTTGRFTLTDREPITPAQLGD